MEEYADNLTGQIDCTHDVSVNDDYDESKGGGDDDIQTY